MIKLKNVNKSFLDKKVLNNINLEIKPKQKVIIKGKSGSGKSTILSLIAGLIKPDSGNIIVKEEFISKIRDDFASEFRRENIGFIFQKFNLIKNLTVKQNVIVPLIPYNLSKEELDKRAKDILIKFDMLENIDKIVNKLSGGEEQRVAIARALINNPDIILADEPTANLDAKLSNEFLNLIQKLDKTIIIATHDDLFFDKGFIEYHLKDGVLC